MQAPRQSEHLVTGRESRHLVASLNSWQAAPYHTAIICRWGLSRFGRWPSAGLLLTAWLAPIFTALLPCLYSPAGNKAPRWDTASLVSPDFRLWLSVRKDCLRSSDDVWPVVIKRDGTLPGTWLQGFYSCAENPELVFMRLISSHVPKNPHFLDVFVVSCWWLNKKKMFSTILHILKWARAFILGDTKICVCVCVFMLVRLHCWSVMHNC